MKKLSITAVLILIFCSIGICASAENGDSIGKIYSTDILALISGNEVSSYNIGGRTVVVAEDISNDNLGFYTEYNESERLLTIDAGSVCKMNTHFDRGQVGEILGDVYETDIKVILNGSYIKGYNIGGKTAVCIEDIGDITDSPNEEYGYSKYVAKYEWNEDDRTISLDFANDADNDLTHLSTKYEFYFTDNTVTAKYDDMNSLSSIYASTDGYTYKNTGEFNNEKYIIKPLYMSLGDKIDEIGFCYVDISNFTLTHLYDNYNVSSELNYYKSQHKETLTYDEIICKFNDNVNYQTMYSAETEDYIMLIVKSLNEEDYVDYIAVNKKGDYTVMYSSSDFDQTKIEKTDTNTVQISVYPFGGPHGPCWMAMDFNMEDCE